MKYFAFLTLFMIVSYLLGFVNRPEKFQWMDRNYTTAIKGFAILTVVWAHSGSRLGVGGIQFIAGIGVALFLICSGYGLEISYKRNGISGFWKKRLLGVCMPFWIVELVGMLITGRFTIESYLKDFAFVKPATSFGWFMGYIVVCYLIFYIVKRFVKDDRAKEFALFGAFAVWFILESAFFANPDIPSLRARQMMSFPVGVMMGMKKDKIEQFLTAPKSSLILAGGGITCLLFMAITQLQVVKELPLLFSNTLALLTCFPMAIGILVGGKVIRLLFENKMLLLVGSMSYEIYLVHVFTLKFVNKSIRGVCLFTVLTLFFACILHVGMRKMKNDRLNGSYTHKK